MKTNTTHAMKRLLALCAVFAALVTLLVLPASAKSANGFQYYLTEVFEDGGDAYAVVTGHKSAVNGTLTIPAKLDGHEVVYIAEAAFSARKDITKVVLPETLNHVGTFAFADCTNLKTLVIGSAWVDRGAFSGCKSLKKVVVTAYKFDGCNPEWDWEESKNEPLFAADVEWLHYKKAFRTVESDCNVRSGMNLTLTTEYDAKKGETYHWYFEGEGVLWPKGDNAWEDYTEKTISGYIDCGGEQTVICEVVNAKGDVVFTEMFHIHARLSLAGKTREVVRETYLYGVMEYTKNHFHWKIMDLLDKMGVNVYGE